MTFNTLGLSDTLLQAVQQTGYTSPTPIQQQAIPEILAGRDVMAAAQTGTGKTAGFTLPLLQLISGRPNRNRNSFRALVLTPTRELAAQIEDSIQTYGTHENLRYGVVFGGVNINPQKKTLNRGLDILVATPGRLLDLYQQKCIDFRDVEVLILDEADRMLDMGFIRDIKKIMALLPKRRQNLMFSATFSDDIRVLAKTICSNPVEIDVAPRNSTVEAISQKMYYVDKASKPSLLIEMMLASNDQTLVFSRTKHGANNLAKKLIKENIKAAAIHGNKSQAQRTKALRDFKQGGVQVLVATDIAARGIDIEQLARVINFDLPHVPEDYVHRIGRTGRAGATGLAISLVSGEEGKQLRDIERLIKFAVPRGDSEEYTFALANPAPASKNSEPSRRPANNQRPRRRQGAAGKPANKGSSSGKWRSSRSRAAA
ncbi:MAG: ATP-dependent RNA helicase [SAR86 cluster bacterium]|uniref:DEAD-box ATP-dependent RNA helicase RhpA n=1 Tax=SAR86 cluster bacterium TaxID=2030880 RepID=A0A2A4X1A9_9GAMM|nr:MAG: ATP-dependent RNA helicase [SAR86 cluster bacterium]